LLADPDSTIAPTTIDAFQLASQVVPILTARGVVDHKTALADLMKVVKVGAKVLRHHGCRCREEMKGNIRVCRAVVEERGHAIWRAHV
jgi:hypothetical protein